MFLSLRQVCPDKLCWAAKGGKLFIKFQILDSLKSCLLKFFREEECSKQSQWLRDAWNSNCNVRSAFITTVENCGLGWDQVRGYRTF